RACTARTGRAASSTGWWRKPMGCLPIMARKATSCAPPHCSSPGGASKAFCSRTESSGPAQRRLKQPDGAVQRFRETMNRSGASFGRAEASAGRGGLPCLDRLIEGALARQALFQRDQRAAAAAIDDRNVDPALPLHQLRVDRGIGLLVAERDQEIAVGDL